MSKQIVDAIRMKKSESNKPEQEMHDDSCPTCGRKDDLLSQDENNETEAVGSIDNETQGEELESTKNKKRIAGIMAKASKGRM